MTGDTYLLKTDMRQWQKFTSSTLIYDIFSYVFWNQYQKFKKKSCKQFYKDRPFNFSAERNVWFKFWCFYCITLFFLWFVLAALQSIFPQAELGTFLRLSRKEKERQLKELAMIVTGIRLFNRETGKGGEGIEYCRYIVRWILWVMQV